MMLSDLLRTYFGPYKFYGVNKKTKEKLRKVCEFGLCGDEIGLTIFLVLLNERKVSMVPKNLKKLYNRLDIYQASISEHILFITNKKNLVPKLKKLEPLSGAKFDRDVGKLLDYPDCCVRAFSEGKTMNINRPRGFNSFILHARCKKSCEKSEKLEMKYASVIKKVCPKMYLHLLGFWFCLTHLRQI